MSTITKLQPFLADTLWFGMSSRISNHKLSEYAKIRVQQGFTAVQVVVGIPPEVGPKNKNAYGASGVPWHCDGKINTSYLDDCEKRIELLNNAGLTVIIYGAWGHQIKWIGASKMKCWWDELIDRFEKYNVFFCICGESNLWIGEADKLLPDKSTDDFKNTNALKKLPDYFPFSLLPKKWFAKAFGFLKKIKESLPLNETLAERKEAWTDVAEHVYKKTTLPIIIHTVNETSLEAINNPEVLSAITTQTGHDKRTKNTHWKNPIQFLEKYQGSKYINLEPWYEGILNNFYLEDQLYAYWTSMLGGAYAFCYGAQGIWNCGDGIFLSHWGKQTFDEALKLDTPKLIGLSHRLMLESGAVDYPYVETEVENNNLIWICRKNKSGDFIKYYPDCSAAKIELLSHCKYYNPLTGKYLTTISNSGPLVVIKQRETFTSVSQSVLIPEA